MKSQYASDLHLELSDNSRLFSHDIPLKAVGDVLVLAGDCAYLRNKEVPCMKFWRWASENYRKVMIIPGNHEYYHLGCITDYGDSWHREILPNVSYHQNEVVRVDDTDFILSTLWSRIDPKYKFHVFRGMNDFCQIRYNDSFFTTDDFVAEHEKCLAFIKKAVAESDAAHKVVVTHHQPTLKTVAPYHKGSPLGSAFATELGDYIAGSDIDLWIYGHSHTNIDTEIGNTRIVSNQLGYVSRSEHHKGFQGDKYIEL